MTTDDSINNFAGQFREFFSNIDFSPIFPILEQIILTSIDRNFSEGGRFGEVSASNPFGGGTQKWKPSKRAIKQSGQTLNDTGTLASSIYVNIYQSNGTIEVEIGSKMKYAAAHHFGSNHNVPVTDISRKFFWSQYKRTKEPSWKAMALSQKDSFKIDLLARPFLVLQEEDLEEFMFVIQEFIAGKIG